MEILKPLAVEGVLKTPGSSRSFGNLWH